VTRLLLDTTILIALVRGELMRLGKSIAWAVTAPDNDCFASAASLWEIAIKTRLRKLDPGMELDELPGFYERSDINLLAIDHRHAVTAVTPEPKTRDPFDRLLLAQCHIENLRLVTVDRALVDHPLAWRE
jgi:PIN domain nuclease of toxin-antitoxin system